MLQLVTKAKILVGSLADTSLLVAWTNLTGCFLKEQPQLYLRV